MYPSTRTDREQWIKEARYNLFNLKSHQVFIDLLTDSGTGAMSQEQWSALMTGDESYAGSQSFEQLKEIITSLTGFPYVLPTHQGRAAENVLFSVMVKEGDVVPGNAHFDTTKGHIEFRKASAFDCTIDEATDTSVYHPFKGNLDIGKLENIFQVYGKERIPMIIVTITCNSTGGQPVSMENLKEVRKFADQYGIPVIFDAARFAENAYFIKTREKGYKNHSIREIVREMFSLADGMTMSSKKDGIVNMGGFIALNSKALYREATTFNIMFEGYITYGGMSGRDMAALAQGTGRGHHLCIPGEPDQTGPLPGRKLKGYGDSGAGTIRGTCHLCGCRQISSPCSQGGVYRTDPGPGTLPGIGGQGRGDRNPAGRPGSRNPGEPLSQAGNGAADHPPQGLYQEPYGLCGSCTVQRLQAKEQDHKRIQNPL